MITNKSASLSCKEFRSKTEYKCVIIEASVQWDDSIFAEIMSDSIANFTHITTHSFSSVDWLTPSKPFYSVAAVISLLLNIPIVLIQEEHKLAMVHAHNLRKVECRLSQM